MKKVIRLTENDLEKIIERVISEQNQNTPVGWKSLYFATSGPGTNEARLEKVFSDEIRNKADFDALESFLSKSPRQGYNYKSIQDVLNGELGDFDRATLDRIASNIKKKTGYSVTYTPDSKRNSVRANTIKINKGVSTPTTPSVQSATKPQAPAKPAQTTQWVKAPSEQEVIAGTKMLKPGAVGDVVTKIQQALGFTGRNIDGKFGNNTFNAVKKFQQQAGLKANGIVGSDTYTILFRPQVEKTNIASKGLKPLVPGIGQQTPQVASTQTGVDDFS
jgi:hypothetical protein